MLDKQKQAPFSGFLPL